MSWFLAPLASNPEVSAEGAPAGVPEQPASTTAAAPRRARAPSFLFMVLPSCVFSWYSGEPGDPAGAVSGSGVPPGFSDGGLGHPELSGQDHDGGAAQDDVLALLRHPHADA